MASNRANKLRAKIQRNLGDPAGIGVAQEGIVYDALNTVMDRICEEANAYEVTGTITLVANTELYNFPDGFIAETGTPYGSDTTPIQKLKNMNEVFTLKRTGSSSSSSTTVPNYYYVLGQQIGFLSPSGSAPTAAGTITFSYFRKRLATGTEDIGESVVPIINSRWDLALELGACAEITHEPKWIALFDKEMDRRMSLENSAQGKMYDIPVVNEDFS